MLAFFHHIIHVGAPHRRTLSLVHTCFFCFHFASVAVGLMAHECVHSFSGPKTRSESRVFPLLATAILMLTVVNTVVLNVFTRLKMTGHCINSTLWLTLHIIGFCSKQRSNTLFLTRVLARWSMPFTVIWLFLSSNTLRPPFCHLRPSHSSSKPWKTNSKICLLADGTDKLSLLSVLELNGASRCMVGVLVVVTLM